MGRNKETRSGYVVQAFREDPPLGMHRGSCRIVEPNCRAGGGCKRSGRLAGSIYMDKM
jgi:hypothetical protein